MMEKRTLLRFHLCAIIVWCIILTATHTIATVNEGDVTSTPVGFWPLDRVHNLQDVSGNENHGSAVGSTLVPYANGTLKGAYSFDGTLTSYIEFPNNGAYDTRYSMTLVAYIYPTGNAGPIFHFKRDGWAVHLWQTEPTQLFARFVFRDMYHSAYLLSYKLTHETWNFVGASYNYDTGDCKLWLNDELLHTINIGTHELATNYEARMGARNGDGRYYKGLITCMQVYDKELSYEEMMHAKSKCNIGQEEKMEMADVLSQMQSLYLNNNTLGGCNEKVLNQVDNLQNMTLMFDKLSVTLAESEQIATVFLSAVGDVMDNAASAPSGQHVSPEMSTELTKKSMDILDKTASFLLKNMENNTKLVINTSSMVLHLESGSVDDALNKTIDLGRNNGFEISMLSPNTSVNTMAYRISNPLGSNDRELHNNILSLAFTSSNGSKIQDGSGSDTGGYIGVWLGRQQSFGKGQGDNVMAIIIDKNIKTLTWRGEVTQQFAALKLTIIGSEIIIGNVTITMHYDQPDNSTIMNKPAYNGVMSVKATMFDVLVPEKEIVHSGNYTFNFGLPPDAGTNYTVYMSQHRCDYWDDDEGEWNSNVCVVSPRSTNEATLCLCSRLT